MNKNTLTIAGRQFRSYFNGPIAYIVVSLVLIILGFLFWETFFLFGRATVREMFRYFSLINYFALPALTMGLIAEEKRTGTIELLITMPVTDAQVIVGKYLGVLGLYAIMVVLTLPYPISVGNLGNLDWGPVFSGYLGLLLQGAALLGIGLMMSSFTDNQLIAFFGALAVSIFFFLVDKFLPFMPSGLAGFAEQISFDFHVESMRRGVIALRDVLFFASIAAGCLLVAFRSLESRRWS
ncbi:MAG TPA: ABC transporter permease [Polyangiaceae bacterium LLY-WYZ-15_(1-7)]|nr:ABC transporter [Myxococcales bacterium]MAT24504.1 ABC transporter [Sandaracinus sp.]HJK93904.1 ABC transporter permease [Polyangiaceae bacterium LLY-WYZ-15_(1-7)]HJL01723.1 ABC transporter permease [Polyangiaceae bacterium LLY-WYZ-15_(1-7)]HJL09879.1 ABC transporter permease [Polyangiaceae bacterium LLY-WYZ-15_(1-7)]